MSIGDINIDISAQTYADKKILEMANISLFDLRNWINQSLTSAWTVGFESAQTAAFVTIAQVTAAAAAMPVAPVSPDSQVPSV